MLQRAMIILWPSFLAASLAEAAFFALVDPREWEHALSPNAVYTLGFFFFDKVRDDVTGRLQGVNYKVISSSYDSASTIVTRMTPYTVFFISTHANNSVFGDCFDESNDHQ